VTVTSKNNVDPDGDDSLGVLDDTTSSDVSAIGLLGGTAQVSVSLPTGGEEDDLVDDEVVDGEIISDLIIDTSAVADADTLARIQQDASEIVIELPAEDPQPETEEEPAEAELIDEPVVAESSVTDAPDASAVEAQVLAEPADAADPADATDAAAVVAAAPAAKNTPAVKAKPAAKAKAAAEAKAAVKAAAESKPATPAATAAPEAAKPEPAAAPEKPGQSAKPGDSEPVAESNPVAKSEPVAERTPAAKYPSTASAAPSEAKDATAPTPVAAEPVIETQGLSELESVVAAAKAELQQAMSLERPRTPDASRPAAAGRPEENRPVVTNDPVSASRPERPTSEAARPELELASKRLDDLGDGGRESADLLTADRLLDPARMSKPEPEGAWSHLLYTMSGGRINVGDGRKARERKQLSARIAAPMTGNARFVPVLSRKGGVGKTTITALLGMALADARDDRVIAVDANPDRGTLAERVVGGHTKSVRDLVRAQHDIRGFHDLSALVARDETRFDVLASDSDPRVSEAFGDGDYRDVATIAAQYYSLVLTDSGTGIVHSVMGATLDLADQIIIVSGLSVDEARLASETLTWLETNGYATLAREAIVVLNQSTPGAPLVRLSELESHFSTRAKHVLRVPYDPQIAGGGAIDFGNLQPATRRAAREIAATLVEGLRAKAA
jgi:MinD-like ATPase involved in chromosome partitioning or flagellar assembly